MPALTRKVDAKCRVTLPEQFARQVVTVESIGEEEVRLRIVRPPRRRPSLASLLAGVPEDYLPDEVSFGPPVGEEQL